MTDDSKPSLWQPVSSAKITDVTPEPITSSATTVSGAADTSRPTGAASTAGDGGSPPRTPPSDRPAVSPPPAPPPRRGALGGLMAGVLLIIVTLGALYVLAPHWLPPLLSRAGINSPGTAPAAAGLSDAERQKLEQQFADLNSRLAALKTANNDPALGEQIKKLQARLDQLDKDQNQLADMIGQLNHGNDTPAGSADQALADKLAGVQKQIETLTAAVASNKNLRGDIDALTAELGKAAERNKALELRLGELEKATASSGALEQRLAELDKINQRNAQLEARVGELDKALAARQNADQRSVEAARASAVTALAARLRANAEAGRPFAEDLAALKPLVAGDADLTAALAALEPLSAGGDGVAALRQAFPPVARATVAAGKNDAAGDWLDKAVARLSSIVSVRRVGDVQGDSVEAHVARAEAALNANRLDRAVAELKPLSGNAGKAVGPWLARAERQLAATNAADKLQALAAQRLAALQAR